jgi:hypothetical protein
LPDNLNSARPVFRHTSADPMKAAVEEDIEPSLVAMVLRGKVKE